MRIEFLHHFPLDEPPVGPWVRRWAQALTAAGHEVRVLVVDQRRLAGDRVAVRRVVCSPTEAGADLPFALPRFGTLSSSAGGLTFRTLSDQQIVAYRDALRRQLDAEVEAFDPHVIHAQHVWIGGQLALETGVPYVLNAWQPEIIDYAADARYRRWADQAAENAAHMLAADQAVLDQVAAMFQLDAHALSIMAADLLDASASTPADQAKAAAQLVALYESARGTRLNG